jgi:hypothetical protein
MQTARNTLTQNGLARILADLPSYSIFHFPIICDHLPSSGRANHDASPASISMV